MKKYLMYLFLVASVAPGLAQAQSRREMCMEKCTAEPGMLNTARQQAHDAKLKQLQDQKAAATDPQVKKQLAEQEEAELEKYQTAVEKVCKHICSAFPQ
ncbi:hypothetical protein GTP44_26090 [Duganella sp. FT50W]|uniref:DUF1090 family protein n=1 Tax=Duganella lactea TaxID=2692173 RepID=A0A6L8MTK6_9BURK|nr:hypothetical protein [Duganella lactea]MYM85392.1 hypothetical protein [Duganella lactea]